jgi:hypothetical protein
MNNNNNNNRGGRRGGAAQRGGRGGAQAPRAGNQVPMSVELRRMERLGEPDELAIVRKFADIRASFVRSTYGVTGLALREIGIMAEDGGSLHWIPVLEAETRLAAYRARQQISTYEGRISVRLANEDPVPGSYAACSEQQKLILRMSQTEYNRRFPAQTGNL